MKFAWWLVAAIWLLLTVAGEILVFSFSLLPAAYSEEAHIIDEAFVVLMALAVPVFAFVMAMLIYTGWVNRTKVDGIPTEDGEGFRDNKKVVVTWLIVTSLLALLVLIFPGFTGLAELRANEEPDIIIDVRSQRWSFVATYPNGGISATEIVLPVDTNIRFDVESIDIVHSFWIPAFRGKIDAVPGRITELHVRPEREGSVETDANLRVQCAELCGAGHATMAIPVRVIPRAEFDQWMAGIAPGGA